MNAEPPMLEYAGPVQRHGTSRWAIASFWTTGIAAAWFVAELTGASPFDVYKHHRIGTVLAILGGISACGAIQDRERDRSMSFMAFCLGIAAAVFYLFVTPL